MSSRTARAHRVAVVAAVLATAVAAGPGSAVAVAVAPEGVAAAPTGAVTTTKTEIQYFVSPHPDDVFEAWSLAQDSPANYPVFITLTKGESTGYCQGRNATVISIDYYGLVDRSTPEGCKKARMASLNNWLDDQSVVDPYLNDYVRAEQAANGYNMTRINETVAAGGTDSGAPTASGMNACTPKWGPDDCIGTNPNVGTALPNNLNPGGGTTAARQVTWYVGSTSARIEFDLGDGNLTDDEVVWAVNHVRSQRAAYLPLTTEYGVVAASYSNLHRQYTACTDYSHHDHRAVQEAVHDTDLIPDAGNHPQWGSTCGRQTTTVGIDAEALPANGGRADKISDAHYRENMATSLSFFQNRFRWLHNGTVWPSASDPIDPVIFAQWNYFWRRFE